MGDRMRCMSFEKLLRWIMEEHDTKGTVFGVHRPFVADQKENYRIFGRKLETVIGPAAGPNSQLAQNIVAAYYAGSRFFELKTVQKMDGAELAACVNKPCIKADDEGYNCEWSTELTVPQAQDEYIKAWFLLSVIGKEYGLGAMDGFQFNMSVGYDLAGIQTQKIDTFIESMKDAAKTPCFQECKTYLLTHIDKFQNLKTEDVEQISSHICNGVTISTLHGCPPQEIEKIASYLLTEKKLHTYIKCNPTLLGYDYARKIMDEMGYDYVAFGRFHFEDDLQYCDAVPMLHRLQELADSHQLEFGIKLTNTFPVDVKRGELPSEEMYMSGKPLYALSMAVAAKLSKDFHGNLPIAYSGGADYFNIDRILACGIWPVTMATTILKPGGYQRLQQIAEKIKEYREVPGHQVLVDRLEEETARAGKDRHHVKSAKLVQSRKSQRPIPYTDCFVAPCEEACPIHQDITRYMSLLGEGRMTEALQVILEKNPLPFITGTICAHGCMSKCTRNFYETPVQIRQGKLMAAKAGYENVLQKISPVGNCDKKVAVVGGGPAGMAAAYYLAIGGAKVTLYEKRKKLGGVVRYVIPDFRIMEAAIDRDASFLKKLGVEIKTETAIEGADIPQLKEKKGYDAVILAVGAPVGGTLSLEEGESVNALEFLENYKREGGSLDIGRNVVVIGGGNTAMDAARAAVRTKGVEKVSLIYRRTKRYMPADEEELQLALADGVEFKELLMPLKLENHQLLCRKTVLEEGDASGRPGVKETDSCVEIPADMVIAAVGEKIPTDYYQRAGMQVDASGKARVCADTLESSIPDVYVIGDGLFGPSIVVKAMANAMTATKAILGANLEEITGTQTNEKTKANGVQGENECIQRKQQAEKTVYERKGILKEPEEGIADSSRCLDCATVCENCVDVCPNRANISIKVPGLSMNQVLHVDSMCNECGNCNSFCPYANAPYQGKFTLFSGEEDMADSGNDGFLLLDMDSKKIRAKVRYLGNEFLWEAGEKNSRLDSKLEMLIQTVCEDYAYLV